MKYILAAVALVVFAIPARAESTKDGNFLLGSCQLAIQFNEHPNERTPPPAYDAWREGVCLGIVIAISFASPDVCPADNVPALQEIRVVVKYLQDHPEKLNLDELVLAHTALAQAFPCKK